MKDVIIRGIGALLVCFGVPKAFACLRTVIFVLPVGAEAGLPSVFVCSATILNLLMVAIALGKVIGGVGLFRVKSWGKWTAVLAAGLHVLLLAYAGIPIWIRIVKGTFENPGGIAIWKDFVTIGVDLVLVIALFILFQKPTRKHLGEQND